MYAIASCPAKSFSHLFFVFLRHLLIVFDVLHRFLNARSSIMVFLGRRIDCAEHIYNSIVSLSGPDLALNDVLDLLLGKDGLVLRSLSGSCVRDFRWWVLTGPRCRIGRVNAYTGRPIVGAASGVSNAAD